MAQVFVLAAHADTSSILLSHLSWFPTYIGSLPQLFVLLVILVIELGLVVKLLIAFFQLTHVRLQSIDAHA